MPMINELMGWDFNFAFTDYGMLDITVFKLYFDIYNCTRCKLVRRPLIHRSGLMVGFS